MDAMNPKPLLPDDANEALPVTRRCGECDLCCTAVGVEAVEGVDKPPGVRCPKLAGTPGTSCSIYADRPYECRQFMCLWRGSDRLLPQNMFPARCGFVVAVGGIFGDFPPIFTVHPDPDRPDNWKRPPFRAAFFELARKFNAIVAIGQGELARHLFSPMGHEFSRARYPMLFKENGNRVGLPDFEFLPWRPTKNDLVKLLFDL